MPIHIVRLGSPRGPDEGPRIGTVRRPPRGVPKAEFATQNWFDTWFPLLAPSAELMKQGQAVETGAQWQAFAKAYRREMAGPAAAQSIALLATLSTHGSLAVGCYCEHEARCHRALLRGLLLDAGAQVAP